MGRGPAVRALAALALAIVLACGAAARVRAADPELAATASFLLPGVGQMANGDYVEGGVHLVLFAGAASRYLHLIDQPDYIPPKEREDLNTHTLRINRTTADADVYGTAVNFMTFYSSFGAYRDARQAAGVQAEYDTPAPQESFLDLAIAPFNPDWLARPTTLAPLLIPLYFVFAKPDSQALLYAPDDTITRNELRYRFFVEHYMVGMGEEAFFRGVLNNGLSDSLGEGWGLFTSSAIFGLAHSGTGAQATAAGATLFGAYLGWLQQRNDYAIGQGVAIHFWWNFLASLAMLKQRGTVQVTLADVYLTF